MNAENYVMGALNDLKYERGRMLKRGNRIPKYFTVCEKHLQNVYALMNGQEIDKNAPKDIVIRINSAALMLPIDLTDAVRMVCDMCDVSYSDIIESNRTREISEKRQFIVYVLTLTGLYTLERIGGKIGRHYSTVIHARQSITDLLSSQDNAIIALATMFCENMEKASNK